MQENRTTPVVYTFRLSRSSLMVGLLGLVALVVGFVAPAQATPPGSDGAHKDYVCKYVGKPGADERLQTGQNPIWVDTAATEGTWFNDGQGRSYVLIADTVKLTPEPDASQCPPTTPPTSSTTSSSPSSSTTSHTTKPTHTTSTSSTTTSSTTTSSTSTSSTTTSSSPSTSPDTGATSPSVTTSTTSPVVAPTTSPEEAPFVPNQPEVVAPAAEQPAVGAVTENAVPQAATDGADLAQGTGWDAGLRYGLVAAGALMLMASGLLSLRRRQVF